MISWSLIDEYKKAHSKLVLLDYDGTLVKFESAPDKATPPDNVKEVLRKLINKSNTKVVILTGRSYQSIEKFLGHLPLDIVADHGAMIKENRQWRSCIQLSNLWKHSVLQVMNKWTQQCRNSFVEDKRFSLAWHFRNSDEATAKACVEKLKQEMEPLISQHSLKIIDGNKVLEIMPCDIGKGCATEYLLHRGTYDYVLSLGDDTSDEEVFEVLSGSESSYTVKVGTGASAAKYSIDEIEGVHWLLETISA